MVIRGSEDLKALDRRPATTFCIWNLAADDSKFGNSFVLKPTEPTVWHEYVTSYKYYLRAALGESL